VSTRQLQTWLNARGARLKVDGDFGPKTRDAFIKVFRSRSAVAISQADLVRFAGRLGASARQIRAVARVEGRGSGWDGDGQLKALYERHYAWRRVRIRVPFLSSPKPGGYTLDADRDGLNDSWEKLADAAARWGVNIALECASFGKFQIMGAWWHKLGYPSVLDFVWSMVRSEAAHYEAFVRYIEVFGLFDALRTIDGDPENAEAFALGFNGPAGVRLGYPVKIAHAWESDR
tara:strand:+ start:90 stop:785 length:696 start_codon:yes stop_codon:yes gene_type:complete